MKIKGWVSLPYPQVKTRVKKSGANVSFEMIRNFSTRSKRAFHIGEHTHCLR